MLKVVCGKGIRHIEQLAADTGAVGHHPERIAFAEPHGFRPLSDRAIVALRRVEDLGGADLGQMRGRISADEIVDPVAAGVFAGRE